MIRTFLPDNFAIEAPVNEIYKTLAKKILEIIGSYPLKCQHREKDFLINTEENIYRFLTDKDFDSYQFSHGHRFLSGLCSLSPNTKLKTVVETRVPDKVHINSKPVERFRYTFQGPEFAQWHINLQNVFDIHPDWTINKFKEELEKFTWTEEYRMIADAFSYKRLTQSDRPRLLDAMDIPVCPYCNMNYTLMYEKDGQIRSTADFDHFYLKSEYPEYALCLYNFIPACPVCNSKLKGAQSMTRATHLYPHTRNESIEGEAQFEITNMASFLLGREQKLNLEFWVNPDANQKNKIEANEQVFHLNSRYGNFQWYVKEWLDKAQIYSEDYMEELGKQMNYNSIQLREMIFGHYLSEQEYGRRSLGKLKNDLLIQFGIFEDPDIESD